MVPDTWQCLFLGNDDKTKREDKTMLMKMTFKDNEDGLTLNGS